MGGEGEILFQPRHVVYVVRRLTRETGSTVFGSSSQLFAQKGAFFRFNVVRTRGHRSGSVQQSRAAPRQRAVSGGCRARGVLPYIRIENVESAYKRPRKAPGCRISSLTCHHFRVDDHPMEQRMDRPKREDAADDIVAHEIEAEYITAAEVAQRLRWSRRTLRAKIRAGWLRPDEHFFQRPGCQPRWKWSRVAEWLEGKCPKT